MNKFSNKKNTRPTLKKKITTLYTNDKQPEKEIKKTILITIV